MGGGGGGLSPSPGDSSLKLKSTLCRSHSSKAGCTGTVSGQEDVGSGPHVVAASDLKVGVATGDLELGQLLLFLDQARDALAVEGVLLLFECDQCRRCAPTTLPILGVQVGHADC